MIKKILSALLFTSIVTAQFSTVTTFTGPAGSSQHAYVGQSDLSGAYSIITGITPVPSPVYGIFTPAGVNLQTAALVSPFETGAKYACDVDGDGIEDTLYGDSIVMALPTTINWIKNLGGTSGPIITSWVIPNPIAGLLNISITLTNNTGITIYVIVGGSEIPIASGTSFNLAPAFGEGGVYCGGCFEILLIKVPCPGYDLLWALHQKCTLCVEQTGPV